MLARADCLVLCAPHTPETENLIGRGELLAMKSDAVLINIARGAMIDETALVDVLEQGHLAFAALDVFRHEPLPPDSPLWDLPNVLVSPHSASTADSENGKLTDLFTATWSTSSTVVSMRWNRVSTHHGSTERKSGASQCRGLVSATPIGPRPLSGRGYSSACHG